jgi:hypothetical protein
MAEGGMHARDLAVALTQVGFDPIACTVDELARQLALGQPEAMDKAMQWVPLIEEVLIDLERGHRPEPEALQERWSVLTRQVQSVVQTGVQAGVPSRAEARSTPAHSSSSHSDLGGLDPMPAMGATLPATRSHGLRLMQQARIANAQDDDRSVRRIDTLLSELQDWSLRLGQRPVATLYPDFTHALQEVWVDPDQWDRLFSLQTYAKRASKIAAQSRSLTVFMEWHGLILNETEFEEVAQVMTHMRGQVRETPEGYKLVFPTSLARMRVIPFVLNKQRYAVAAAQYVQFEAAQQAPEGAGKVLLRAGRVTKALTVDQVLAAENANITPIPEVIDRPDWLVGVIVSQEAEVCLCVVPV